LANDKLVPTDYDGNGKTDPTVYRDGTWYIVRGSNASFNYQQFGLSGEIRSPAFSKRADSGKKDF